MRDDFSKDTRLVLAHRANLICSNPDCEATTGGPQDNPSKALNIGVAAHITAASVGGERYDDSITPDQRSSSENGIWLCQNCAKLVDNDPSRYPADLLHAWKIMREHNAQYSIGKTFQRRHENENQRKAKEILKSTDRRVMLVKTVSGREATSYGTTRPWVPVCVNVLECNEFYVVVFGPGWDRPRSIPMDTVRLGRDHNQSLEILAEY